jgi:precorrin isomerase
VLQVPDRAPPGEERGATVGSSSEVRAVHTSGDNQAAHLSLLSAACLQVATRALPAMCDVACMAEQLPYRM